MSESGERKSKYAQHKIYLPPCQYFTWTYALKPWLLSSKCFSPYLWLARLKKTNQGVRKHIFIHFRYFPFFSEFSLFKTVFTTKMLFPILRDKCSVNWCARYLRQQQPNNIFLTSPILIESNLLGNSIISDYCADCACIFMRE